MAELKHLVMHDQMTFYTPEQLGKTRSITPEGFLVCESVPIARTGEQRYKDTELPLDGDEQGEIRVQRPAEEVFRDETIASFAGKPVTVEHPNEFVTPENWERHEVGTVLNPRQGTGAESDLLIADLLIKDPEAIAYVNRERPEVSCGYNSDYEQTGPGAATQHNIVGNHVALVDRGRAGPRCSIQDNLPKTLGVNFMSQSKITRAFIKLLTGFHSKDAEKMSEATEELEDAFPEKKEEKTEAKSQDAELKEVLDWVRDRKAKDAAEETAKKENEMKDAAEAEENRKKAEAEAKDAVLSAETGASNTAMFGTTWTGDSASATLKDILSRAELLSPGIGVPVGDAVSHSSVKALMQNALAKANATEVGRGCIAPFLLGRTLAALDGKETMGVFTGAAELMRRANNRTGRENMRIVTKDFGKTTTAADVQKSNDDFWAAQRK